MGVGRATGVDVGVCVGTDFGVDVGPGAKRTLKCAAAVATRELERAMMPTWTVSLEETEDVSTRSVATP